MRYTCKRKCFNFNHLQFTFRLLSGHFPVSVIYGLSNSSGVIPIAWAMSLKMSFRTFPLDLKERIVRSVVFARPANSV